MTATFRGDRGRNQLLHLLQNSVVVDAGQVAPERELKLDVFGKRKSSAEVEAKVVEVALAKQQELPVILILPSIADCERFKHHFK
jgi:hypothetical protein